MRSIGGSPTLLRIVAFAAAALGSYAGVEGKAWSQPMPGDMQPAVDPSMETDPAAFSQFRDTLQPYGAWVDDPNYGTVWVPRATTVGSDFTPYVSAGHWALTTDDEWTWVSDYSWGAVPFHYGRWAFIAGVGWAWVPGSVYAPAWVEWRTGNYDGEPYVGWAPMAPSWRWRDGVAVPLHAGVRPHYYFVPSRHAFRPEVRAYVAPPARAAVIAPRTQPYVAARPDVRYRPLVIAHGPTLGAARVPREAVPVQRVPYPARPGVTSAPVRPPAGYERGRGGGPRPPVQSAPPARRVPDEHR
jgi:hypothetical protein